MIKLWSRIISPIGNENIHLKKNLWKLDNNNKRSDRYDEYQKHILFFLVQQSTSSVPFTCPTERGLGPYCNISNTVCDMLNPCRNGSTCINTNRTLYGYNCSCQPGFSGIKCEVDNRPCGPNPCWNNGIQSLFYSFSQNS
jgi:hypothetical protein